MTDSPLILGIAGSPRRHGNSEQMLDAALEGAVAAGARTRKLIVADADIRPCKGCNSCSLTGECVIRDGMQELYAQVDSADAFIVASPVFFATVPSVLKILYDRMQPYWARVHVLGEVPSRRRPGGFLVVRGGGDPYGFLGAQYATKSVFAVLGIDYVGEVKVEAVDSPSDVGRHPGALEDARVLGGEVAGEAFRRAKPQIDRPSDESL